MRLESTRAEISEKAKAAAKVPDECPPPACRLSPIACSQGVRNMAGEYQSPPTIKLEDAASTTAKIFAIASLASATRLQRQGMCFCRS